MLMGLEWNTNPGLWDINGGYDVCVYIYIYVCVCVCVKTGYSWDVLSNQSCAKPKSDIVLPSPVHIKQTHNHGFRWCLI